MASCCSDGTRLGYPLRSLNTSIVRLQFLFSTPSTNADENVNRCQQNSLEQKSVTRSEHGVPRGCSLDDGRAKRVVSCASRFGGFGALVALR